MPSETLFARELKEGIVEFIKTGKNSQSFVEQFKASVQGNLGPISRVLNQFQLSEAAAQELYGLLKNKSGAELNEMLSVIVQDAAPGLLNDDLTDLNDEVKTALKDALLDEEHLLNNFTEKYKGKPWGDDFLKSIVTLVGMGITEPARTDNSDLTGDLTEAKKEILQKLTGDLTETEKEVLQAMDNEQHKIEFIGSAHAMKFVNQVGELAKNLTTDNIKSYSKKEYQDYKILLNETRTALDPVLTSTSLQDLNKDQLNGINTLITTQIEQCENQIEALKNPNNIKVVNFFQPNQNNLKTMLNKMVEQTQSVAENNQQPKAIRNFFVRLLDKIIKFFSNLFSSKQTPQATQAKITEKSIETSFKDKCCAFKEKLHQIEQGAASEESNQEEKDPTSPRISH